MHVITRKRLREFAERFPDAARPLDDWYKVVTDRRYSNPHAVQQDFATVSFLGKRRTVFNIGGNKYRLVVDIRYDLGRIYIRGVLTHAEYDARTATGTL